MMGKFSIALLIIGIVGFQLFAKQLFPEGGLERSLAAGVVGAIFAGVGAYIDRIRK